MATNLGLASWFSNMASSFSALAFSLFRRASSFSRSISSIMGIKPRAVWVDTCTMPSVLPSYFSVKVTSVAKANFAR